MKGERVTYDVVKLSSVMTAGQIEQLRLRDDISGPLIDWLHKRSDELQRVEDDHGQWGDSCLMPSLHVRALKGARNSCDDIRKEIESVLNK